MPRAPRRVGTDEIERIRAGSRGPAGCDADDHLEKLVAMAFGFFCKFFVDRVPAFGAFALQQLEGALPDAVTLPGRSVTTRQASGSLRKPTLW